jgi:hypothetical protein
MLALKLCSFLFRFSYFVLDCAFIYRVIKKSLCTWWLQHRKVQVMFKVSPASLSRHLSTRRTVFSKTVFSIVQSTFRMWSVIAISCVGIFRQVHRDFLITLYIPIYSLSILNSKVIIITFLCLMGKWRCRNLNTLEDISEQIFQKKFRRHLKILETRSVSWSKFRTEDPQFCSDLWDLLLSGVFCSVRVNRYASFCT